MSSRRFRTALLVICGLVSLLAPACSQAAGLAFGSLTVPGVQWLDGGQQEGDQRVSDRLNPWAVLARARSRNAFAHMSAAKVKGLLSHTFPNTIDRPAGGESALPRGARLLGYPSAHALDALLPAGGKVIVESSLPVARRTSTGRLVPIDLSLTAATRGFAAVGSDLDVRIPRRISGGVRIPHDGVSLTPVGPKGKALAGTGSIVGAAVVYANTQPATDAVVKPTAQGFQLDAVLRSASSPQLLRYRVGAPAGARLLFDRRSDEARVVRSGRTLAVVSPPAAVDAAGFSVPASMRVVGSTIVVSVAHRAGSYLYPIDVDPEVNDAQLSETTGGKRSNWEFKSSNEARFAHKAIYEGAGKERLETTGVAEYVAEEVAYWGYETKGNSKIYELKAKTSAKNKGSKIESFLEFQTGTTRENAEPLSNEAVEPEYTEKSSTICAWNASKVEECLPAAGKEKNAVRFQQSAAGSPGANFKFSDTMSEGIVSITEPSGDHATTSFNTTSPEVEGEVEIEGKKVSQKRTNALYGSGIWLTNGRGALQMIAKDPGIGVSSTHLEYERSPGSWERLSEHNYLEAENGCQGVQCYQEHREYWTLDPKLPDGLDKIRYRAQEAMAGTESPAEEAESTKTIEVDTKAPHSIVLGGLPWGDELSEKAYKLTAEATDGEGSVTASSGIPGVLLGSKGEVLSKGLALYVDGSEVAEVGTQTGCSATEGQCTAKAQWTINGAELGAGHHAIVLVARDVAGNERRMEYTISIRHSTPVALGPGSVDLQSGDFALSSGDVDMGSGLTVGRSYSSRALDAGIEGPLGPQWSIQLGSTESLVEMVDHSILLTDGKGKQVIFASLGAREFEAPTGDANLKLKLEENETTKEKLAYYLEDATAHTKTKFTLPSGGSREWVPTRQEGDGLATDTVIYTYQTAAFHNEYPLATGSEPTGIVKGPDGNMWVAETGTSKIAKVTPAGAVSEYEVEHYLGEGGRPQAGTLGSDGNLWFTAFGTSRIVKVTPAGVVKEYSLTIGTHPMGITTGADGNLWFTEYSASKIVKMGTSGAIIGSYSLPSGSEPHSIVQGPDGNLWFTDYGTNKIGKTTTAGVVTEYALPAGYGPRSITAGPDGNLWFTDANTNKIGKITTAGTITEYSLPTGSYTSGIAVGPDGNIWFGISGTGKMGKITTAGVISEYPSPGGAGDIAIGTEGDIWSIGGSGKVSRMTTAGEVTEPTEALAPVPAGVSCTPMKAGCRALKFTYASSTTATGEELSQWGEFAGRLSKVWLDAYNPVSKTMQETAVAQYSYDMLGRLRAEWDPRISPALKTTYGYDSESHVTALSPAGQETWAFAYGAIASDAGTGRLLKVSRAPASEALWSGAQPKSTAEPTISGTLAVNVRLSVSNGTWSGAPTAYSYQWQRCDSKGEGCVAIYSANNANYTPVAADIGHKLRAIVTATNGDGSVSAVTAIHPWTPEVVNFQTFEPTHTGGAKGIVQGHDGRMWFTEFEDVGAVTPLGTVTRYPVNAGAALQGITVDRRGELWFTLSALSKVDSMTSSGTVTGHSLPANSDPWGVAEGPDEYIWFTEYGPNKVGKISESSVVEYALPTGKTAINITPGADGNMWFTEPSNQIGKITTSGAVTEYTLPAESQPFGITKGPDGNVWFTDYKRNKIGKITPAGAITEYSLPAGSGPEGIVTDTNYNLSFVDHRSGKIGYITTSGTITEYALAPGTEPEYVADGPEPEGNLWYTNYNAGPVSTRPAIITEGEAQTPSAGYTLDYEAPLTAGAGLAGMTTSAVGKWGQSDAPVEATAIEPPDARQGWPASSYTRATVYYLDERGRLVNTATPSSAPYGSISTSEYNEANDVVRTLSPDNRQTALEAGEKSVDVAKSLSAYYSYRSMCSKQSESNHETESQNEGSRLCDVEGPQHTIKYVAGKEQHEALGRLHTKYFYDEEAPAGETYNLQTRQTTLAQLTNEEEVEVRKSVTSYSGQSNLGWKLRAPTSVTTDPEGKKLTTTTFYDSATGQVTETRAPAGGAGNSPHDTKYIYYSAEANTEGYSACGSHPEWAGLLCETLPAKQPETGRVPNLPVTVTSSYNVYDEPLVITETFGSTVRTKTKTYDEAGRLLTSETTSTANTALPKLTDEYNSKTGVLEKLSTTVEGKTQSITSKHDTLGELVEYTDADGNIAKYRYAGPENDWLLEEIADGSNGGTGKQTYAYSATTKQLEELTDSAAGVFKASYDAEGNVISETYPNAMCADSTYNSVGEATKIEYIKTGVCSEHSAPVWFSETRVPSVRGETLTRASTLAGESYLYDSVGRLTEAQETPAGEGCSERLYSYDEEGDRTSQTTRTPGVGGKCATEGGTLQEHSYDGGNRLTDTGVGYDSFGDITKLPAGDAEGHELTNSYYVDGAVASQSQNGVTNSYRLDPEGRVREMTSGLNSTVDHYDGSGQAVVWTSESGGKTTRNIPGIDGSLAATQTNGGTPVLQLRDLQGDVTATAALSPSETKLLSTYNSTEFGVPNKEGAPPKFGWLGAGGIASSLSSGVITYGATSYVPQIGRALQSETVEAPGIAPHGTGAGAAYVSQEEPWVFQGAVAAAAEAPGREAARELAAAEAALRAAIAEGGIDPHRWFFQKEAVEVGEKLNAIKSWSEVWGTVFTLLGLGDPEAALVGAVVGVVSLGVMEDWLHNTGGKLEQCGKNRERWVAGCELSFEELPGGMINFYSTSEVEKCGTYEWYAKKIFLKSAWECRRLNQKPGPV